MTTDKHNLFNLNVGTQGWDSIFDTNMDILDDAISTIEIREYGETIAEYEVVYIKPDGLFWLAKANGTQQPGFGVAIDAGIATDEKRVKTRGLVTNSGWSWSNVGSYVYLDPTTSGALTETQPADNSQIIGVILSATEVFINPSVVPIRPLQVGGTYNGAPTASLFLTILPISQGAVFPISMLGSHFYAAVTATTSTIFNLKKEGVSFGTITFLPDTTINAAAAVDKGGGLVGIPITGHGFSTRQNIIISGTTNYNGTYEVESSSTTNEVVIEETYVAETFSGTEDILMNWGFFVSAAGATFDDMELLTMIAPVTPDATLANLGWNLVGSRIE